MNQQQPDGQRNQSSTSPPGTATGGNGGPTPGVPSDVSQQQSDTQRNQSSTTPPAMSQQQSDPRRNPPTGDLDTSLPSASAVNQHSNPPGNHFSTPATSSGVPNLQKNNENQTPATEKPPSEKDSKNKNIKPGRGPFIGQQKAELEQKHDLHKEGKINNKLL